TALPAGVPRPGADPALLQAAVPPAGEPVPARDDERGRPVGGADRPGAAAAVLVPGDAAGRGRAGPLAGGAPAARRRGVRGIGRETVRGAERPAGGGRGAGAAGRAQLLHGPRLGW